MMVTNWHPHADVPAVEIHGLCKAFGRTQALDGMHLTVSHGSIAGFLGPNGAGKSTTVHMLTTLLPPTAGSARVAGHDVVKDGAAVRDAIGAALQEAALDPNLSAREHMRLQGALHGMSKADRTKRGNQLIERVGLSDAADRKVGGYSGGMKRRLDLALALLHGPRVLFLDEPTTGLDIQSRTALWDEVAHLSRDEGMTVFLTTQYLEEADQLADHLGIIDHGKIVAAGTPAALKAQVGRPTVEVVPTDHSERDRAVELLRPFGELVPGTPQGAAVRLDDGSEELANIIRAFDQAGVRVANLELHEASLNDVFLTKTGRSLEGAQREAEEEGETGEHEIALEGSPA
jgi:ABC-2 type transport system ATP-binding protein